MRSISYMPHIDGLRGIAVLAVLLFHFDVPYFSGGYVGVDVFFVISGFLISSIIIKKSAQGGFSFKDFYLKRIKRLIPTMISVVLLTLVTAFILFPSHQFERLLKSSMSSFLSFSNIFFFNESGYFDTATSSKPLLHTWSLSVEEQFYLIWPLLLYLTLKLKKETDRVGLLIAIGVLSLFFSQYYLSVNDSVSFFLTPFRIFEFIIGASICWLQKYSFSSFMKIFFTISSFVGLLVIFYVFNHDTSFPGLNALYPCLFSAILIHNTGDSKISVFLFNNSLFRWLGKISYSLYLVHWPLVVFYKYVFGSELSYVDVLILFSLSLVISSFIYYLIESPLRTIQEPKKVRILYGTILFSILSVVLFNLSVNVFNFKLDNTMLSLKEIEEGKNRRFKFCHDINKTRITFPDDIKEKRVLVVGDSHAPDALNFLKLAYPDYHYHMETEGGCPPIVKAEYSIIDGHPVDMKLNCYKLNDKLFSNNYFSNFDYIVINVMFGWYTPEHLVNAIKEIKSQTSAKIIVFGNYVIFKENLPEILARNEIITNDLVESNGLYDNELRVRSKGLYTFISKKELLCSGEDIQDCLIMVSEKAPITYDSNHLSFELTEKIAEKIISKKLEVFN